MIVYRVRGYKELFGNLLAVESSRQQIEHFHLTFGDISPSCFVLHIIYMVVIDRLQPESKFLYKGRANGDI